MRNVPVNSKTTIVLLTLLFFVNLELSQLVFIAGLIDSGQAPDEKYIPRAWLAARTSFHIWSSSSLVAEASWHSI